MFLLLSLTYVLCHSLQPFPYSRHFSAFTLSFTFTFTLSFTFTFSFTVSHREGRVVVLTTHFMDEVTNPKTQDTV